MRVFIGLFIISLASCQQVSEKERQSDLEDGFQFPKIKDTLLSIANYFPAKSVSYAENKIEAMQPFTDNLYSLNNGDYTRFYLDSSINRSVEKRYDGLQIAVDTTTQLVVTTNHLDGYNFTLDDTRKKYFKTYPCYIYNETDSVKWVYVQDGRVVAILEALDSSYNWKPIQIWEFSWCGNSYESVPLKKNYFIMFKIPIFNGSEAVTLRVKFYNRYASYYSNEFPGKISYRQFEFNKYMLDKKKKLSFNNSVLKF